METLLRENLTRSDMQLLARAFRHGWGVRPSERKRIVDILQRIAADPMRTARDQKRARQTLDVIAASPDE